MDFVALDFETANPRLTSICQVGASVFRNGVLARSYCVDVDPDDYFDPIHISIHGIDERRVAGAPRYAAVHDELASIIGGAIAVTHTSFDRTALHRTCAHHGLPTAECRWLDSSMVVRRAWPEFARSGYGLGNVSRHLGLEFRHHDAGEDSRVTGEILMHAIGLTGLSLEDWLEWVRQPITPSASASVAQVGRPDGPVSGEVIVFTGALAIPRREAAALAAQIGCDVGDGVTKQTTLLVVGDQDLARLCDGETKSSKHRKAEAAIRDGQSIRILSEADFLSLVEDAA